MTLPYKNSVLTPASIVNELKIHVKNDIIGQCYVGHGHSKTVPSTLAPMPM